MKKEGGVEPDISVEQKPLPLWQLEERRKLRDSEALLQYTEENLDALRPIAILGDGGKAARYPGLDKVLSSLDTRGTEKDVRQVIRSILRRKLEDERGRQFAVDLQEDLQLQQGILSLLAQMKKKPAEIEDYSWITPQAVTKKTE